MRHCYVLRVFTRGDGGGNHLGVIMDPTGLDTDTMQGIAADLGFSETVFIDWSADALPHARIFTPASELPFAGHPLVGAAWVLHAMGPGGPEAITCGIGEIGIDYDGEIASIVAPLGQTVTELDDAADRAARLGLPTPRSMAAVAMPLRYVVVELEKPDAVSAYRPDEASLGSSEDGEMLLVWARGPGGVTSRFFAPEHGVFEDPATGSAAVALTAVLQQRGQTSGALEISQGDEIGWPSTIRIEWSGSSVRVGGTVRRDEVRELEI